MSVVIHSDRTNVSVIMALRSMKTEEIVRREVASLKLPHRLAQFLRQIIPTFIRLKRTAFGTLQQHLAIAFDSFSQCSRLNLIRSALTTMLQYTMEIHPTVIASENSVAQNCLIQFHQQPIQCT